MEPVKAVIVMSHLVAEMAEEAMGRTLAVLARLGVSCLLPPTEVEKHGKALAAAKGQWESVPQAQLKEAAARAQLCLVLGGDGTTLRAFHRVGNRVPVVGVNLGRVSFLSTMDRNRIEEDLEQLLSGQVVVHQLPGLVVSGGECQESEVYLRPALNDVFVGRRHESTICHLAYALNEEQLYDVRCDGLVVATPVGSSAYNLSAGGPLLGLGVEAYVATFVAAHTVTARPVVAGAGHRLRISNLSTLEPAIIVLDGEAAGQLAPECSLEVELVPAAACLGMLPGDSLYRNFRNRFL